MDGWRNGLDGRDCCGNVKYVKDFHSFLVINIRFVVRACYV